MSHEKNIMEPPEITNLSCFRTKQRQQAAPGGKIYALCTCSRVGRGNLSIFLHSTARENFKLMTNGSLTIPIAQMALPLATPVAYLNELGNPGIV